MSATGIAQRTGRREALRARLQAQRLVIAGRLGVTEGPEGPQAGYPRSATMRLISRQPELVARALGLAFSLFRTR